jgi:ATP adenylyltransferase
MALIAGAGKEPGCIFCDKPRSSDRRESLVLAVTPRVAVLLNKYPYNNGHLMVAPRKHVADLERLGPADRDALSDALVYTIRKLRGTFRPEGMNVGLNLGAVAGAGIADHLHWHVVPRWNGDTNFMPVVASTKVMPQHLLETWDTLRPKFAELERRSRPRRRR